MAKQALIVVDIQNDYFPQGKWPLVGADAAADNAARLIQAFREAGDSVVHIRHEFTSEEAPFFTPNSDSAKLHPKVLNRDNEPVVLKHFVNSFRETELKSILDEQGIKELVVVGSMSHMCVDGITRAADSGAESTVSDSGSPSTAPTSCGRSGSDPGVVLLMIALLPGALAPAMGSL